MINIEKRREYHRKKEEEYRRKRGVKPSTGINHWNWSGKIICPTCSGKKAHKSKECRKCSYKTYSQENHPNWTGGHNSFRKYLYETGEYKRWRESVFKRDNFTCQKCFKRSVRLEAHHIKRMILIIKQAIPNYKNLSGYLIKTKLLSYKPMWDLNNGLTLCLNCHNEEKKLDKKIIQEALRAIAS